MALSAMLTAAVRLPTAAGVNVALMVQLPFAGTELLQLLVTAKSPGSAPVAPMLVMVKAAFPLFVRVTDCAALVVTRFCVPKLSDAVERLTTGALPVPVRAIASGLLWRLSVMLTVAVRVPEAAGANCTTIAQLAFCANELPQPFVSEKSPGLAPTILTLFMEKVALPVFVIVTLWAVLVVPTVCVAKVRLEGERLT